MTEKIIGYVLLSIGIIVIVASTFAAYQVFTRQAMPTELFRFPAISVDLTQAIASGLPKELVSSGFSLPPQQQEIIPAAMINQPMNFFTYLIFMGFVASAGAKLAGLGIQLIRPIVVKVKETSLPAGRNPQDKN